MAFKTKFIPTTEANFDPILEQMQFDEFTTVLSKKVFDFLQRSQEHGNCIYISGFTDEIKNFGTPHAQAKILFVICGHGDTSHDLITHATTVQHCSCRIFFSTNAWQPGRCVASRDITQSYGQASTRLQRSIYAQALLFLDLGPAILVILLLPLFGLV